MSRLLIHLAATLAAGVGVACQRAPAPAHAAAPSSSSPAKVPQSTAPQLDEFGPRVDLLANRALWHIYQRGLVIPFASEGFRKYSQEYTSPWRGVTKLQDRSGRVLGATTSTLRFPWDGETGTATIVVRTSGDGGQRLSLRLNGKPLKTVGLAGGWQAVAINVPAGVLRSGENDLAIAVAKKGAVFHSLEVLAGLAPEPADAWPALSPVVTANVAGQEKTALGGFRRYVMLLEIPRQSSLVLETAAAQAAAHLRISVQPEGQPAQVLLDETQQPGRWQPHTLSLAALAGKLVELEFAIVDGGEVLWATPRILLPAAPSLPRPNPVRNLVLLIGDAMRADSLALYGQTKVLTPRITEAGRKNGVVFLNTQAASPSSPPSHASIQSGTLPRVNGILGDKAKLNPGTPMISAVLGAEKIATGYYGDNSFAMGRLKAASKWTAYHQPSQEGKGGGCPTLIKMMLGFADEQIKAGRRFFLSSIAFEPHTPYIYHQGITEHYVKGEFDPAIGKSPDGVILTAIVKGKLPMTPARWQQLRGLYDGEVEYLDQCFGTLVDGLAARGQRDDTAIILLADHGEGFFEHGSLGHAYGHWFEVTQVPLVLWVPGLTDKEITVDTTVSHVDVAPTILDLLGLLPEPRMQGQSLLPMVLRQGPWTPRVIPAEYGRSYSLRSAHLRYIVDYGGKEMLYDTAADPIEKTDVKDQRPMALRYLRDCAGFYLAHRSRWHMASWGTLNNQTPEFVQATGG
ncbi:MAG: sulfatase [Polyangia bacterium]|jgi:arylsulfatase A-like enzyme